jgi:Flp pilus assembly pilin Flp
MRSREAAVKRLIATFLDDTSGATSIEYGMIALVISIGAFVALTQASVGLQGFYKAIATAP